MISETRLWRSLPRRMLVGLVCLSVCGVAVAPGVHAEAYVRAGGSLGFGLSTTRQGGAYKWDFGSRQQPVDLVRLKIEASPATGWVGFLRLDAPSTGFEDPPNLELGEASLRYTRDWDTRAHVAFRAFARQPQSLWLDHTLGAPVDARQVGDEVLGVRADAAWHSLFATVLVADPATNEFDATPRPDPFALLRGGVDLPESMRLGATWMRETPHAATPPGEPTTHPSTLHWGSLDLTWQRRGVFLLLDYAVSSPSSDAERDAVSATPQRPLRGALDGWPETGALRAEIRAASLGSPNWGWVGLAPSVHIVGSRHTQRNRVRQAEWGTPRRGFQAWRAEAWVQASRWPVWVRQVYDSNESFVDAARRVDISRTEVEATLTSRLRARGQWVARRVDEDGGRQWYRDLLADAWIEEIGRRLRAQFGWLDIDKPSERQALALEYSTPILGRWNAVARAAATREAARLRPSFFAELQYWHLPQFEFALSYGSEVFGDAADPVLDADQIVAGDTRNVVRIHFRGWF